MGPGDGIQIQRLMDLPTTLETADSPSPSSAQNPGHGSQSSLSSASQSVVSGGGQQQGVQRVKSMFQQSTGKLGSSSQRLPGTHPAPPQRSISHNEVTFPFLSAKLHYFFVFRIFCFVSGVSHEC